MKPLILFDFDGVLVDSLSTLESALNKSLLILGHKFLKHREDFLDLFRDNLYIALSKKGVSDEDVKKCFEYLGKHVIFSKLKLFNGIVKVLDNASKISHVGIVSSNKESQILEVLEANGLKDYFELILGHDAGLSKVDKLKTAMVRFGTSPDDTYYAVDTTGDLKEAALAKVKTIAVGWGWHDAKELKEFKPDYFVEDCDKLIKLITSICQGQQ